MQRCKVCDHAERSTIEAAVASGIGKSVLAKRYGVTLQSLTRHMDNHYTRGITEELDFLRRTTQKILDSAAPEDSRTIFAAIDRLQKLTQLRAKIQPEIAPEPDVIASEGWKKLRARILQALEPFPEAREALLAALREDEE